MSIETGNGGNVTHSGGTDIAHVRNWSMTLTSEPKEYTTSDTAGNTFVKAGNKKKTGKVECYLDGSDVGIVEGTRYAFVLTGGNLSITDNFLVTELEYGVDIEGAEFDGCTVSIELAEAAD